MSSLLLEFSLIFLPRGTGLFGPFLPGTQRSEPEDDTDDEELSLRRRR
jgi:hypothetical protein